MVPRESSWTYDRRAMEIINAWLDEDLGYGTFRKEFQDAGMKNVLFLGLTRLNVLIREALMTGYKEARNLGSLGEELRSGIFCTAEERERHDKIILENKHDTAKQIVLMQKYLATVAPDHGLDPATPWTLDMEGQFVRCLRWHR